MRTLKEALESCIGEESKVKVDYIAVADRETLEELTEIDRPALVLLAIRAGPTRLIDNAPLMPLDAGEPRTMRQRGPDD